MGIEFVETDEETKALLGRVIEQLTQDLKAAPA